MNEGHDGPFVNLCEVVGHGEVILRSVLEAGARSEEGIAQTGGRTELEDSSPLLEGLTLPLGTKAYRSSDDPFGREVAVVLPLTNVFRPSEYVSDSVSRRFDDDHGPCHSHDRRV